MYTLPVVDHRFQPFRITCFYWTLAALIWLMGSVPLHAELPSPSGIPNWAQILDSHRDRLAAIDSDQSATDLFVGALGQATGLADAAGTIGAKGLPAKLAKELMVPDITQSARRLVASLAVWHTAEQTLQAIQANPGNPAARPVLSPAQRDWLNRQAISSAFPSAVQQTNQSQTAASDVTELALSAGHTVLDASQQATAEWWRLKTWKDRVRGLRGQSRLCGTWQWAIHNHAQHHHEQKLSLIFPPPGQEQTGIAGLTEIIVLGDIVYLRWDLQGQTQEDSLLFTKEGQRLEGTFVNSQGGWGSISGKRTAGCTP